MIGAAGYTGQEVLRLLQGHPGVEVVFATSSREAGRSARYGDVVLIPPGKADLAAARLVFLCLPHGTAVPWAVQAREAGVRVVDLTADHRPGSGREEGAVYGMADLLSDEIADAALVANPGCYPTGVILTLHPLLEEGVLIRDGPWVIDAASGVTGAGRTPRPDLLFAEVAGNFRAYAEGNVHRHLKEMRALLPETPLLFQPHLLPVARGILETFHLPVAGGVAAEDVLHVLERRYADHPTVAVVRGRTPALADVVETDVLLLGAVDNEGLPGMVTLVAALDNLGKGAAGQALHNMNLMLGFPPEYGLRIP
ncbi:MAG: N-acetyl-gamma-glutamyl-phosphate reductase [Gemmatimonadota bacterium]